ncbi:MAG: hypothetical protein QOJ16_3191 [Acidobacteriota bacterium]|jgi:hypothetical protein|nr:hypothetical protein [Acidobacteriota bacterium]
MRGLRRRLRSLRLTLELLLGRRLLLFALLDLTIVGAGLFSMLLQPEGAADSPYLWMFLLPCLALGLPALAGMVDVERRAGCLDLALSAPAAEVYFLRRAAAVGALMALQGGAVMLLAWLLSGRDFPLLSPLLSVAAVSVFLAAVALFWAVRLRSAGAVWLASTATVVLFGSWVFAAPIPPRFDSVYGPLLPGLEAALPWLGSVAVLSLSSALFFLYSRRRLRRPERMIS